MEHLIIITPLNGLFDQLLNSSFAFRKTSVSVNFVYYTYIGVLPPKPAATDFINRFDIKEFSLVKEGNCYKLHIRVE